MNTQFSFKDIAIRLLIITACSGIVGYFLEQTLVMLLTSTIAILIWHYHHLYKLLLWLSESKTLSPPQSMGTWGAVFQRLSQQVKKQRQRQKLLNDKIRKFRDGAEALPDAVLVLASDFTVEWGNKKARRLLGIHVQEDSGQHLEKLLPDTELVKFIHEGNFDSTCLIASPITTGVMLELRLMDYGSDQWLFLARDVSKIYQLEKMRRDFVANVSHELKTPLTVVRGYVEMVQTTEHALDPYWQKVFGTMETQVTRMTRLVEKLLELSRVEINIADEDKQNVDMSELINGLVDDSVWLNKGKQHTITAQIDPSISIYGIENELKSACSNLISNAISYTEAGGNINISWQMVGNKAKFSVIDDGAGILPEHVNRITERFFRVDKSRSRDTGGFGLGLAIVKHVLAHHHGELAINSTLGEGSEFSIIFSKKGIRNLKQYV